jgi:hypothetical protein
MALVLGSPGEAEGKEMDFLAKHGGVPESRREDFMTAVFMR